MIRFRCLPFAQLSTTELYAILKLRAEVFVMEQNCLYLDVDGKDEQALHFLGMADQQLSAYLRVFPPANQQEPVVFGRVVTSPLARGKGYGKKLIKAFMEYAGQHYPGVQIKCSAQHYLQHFYEEFGLTASGEIYLEDDIPHIAMQRSN